ncbi:hypothetical protein H8E88_29630 [candidate division KSB1 bacterium]|nr:hypothetical protein [candidate division KSB1 bacterium]
MISDNFHDPLCRLFKQQPLAPKREFSSGKINIGIDPAKDKQQVRILDAERIPIGKTFSFKTAYPKITIKIQYQRLPIGLETWESGHDNGLFCESSILKNFEKVRESFQTTEKFF